MGLGDNAGAAPVGWEDECVEYHAQGRSCQSTNSKNSVRFLCRSTCLYLSPVTSHWSLRGRPALAPCLRCAPGASSPTTLWSFAPPHMPVLTHSSVAPACAYVFVAVKIYAGVTPGRAKHVVPDASSDLHYSSRSEVRGQQAAARGCLARSQRGDDWLQYTSDAEIWPLPWCRR